MAYIYAELDENNICCAVSDLSGEVIADTMIPLETYDTSLLGMKYVDGVWEEVPHEEESEPTEAELMRERMRTLVEAGEMTTGQYEVITGETYTTE